jgi:eukaryotic-like serine/threonine-protein kinase
MAAVWSARDESLNRDVAIKVGDGEVTARPDARERFLNEARSLQRLRHPNIVDMIDSGELPDGRLFIEFELLSGRSLEQHVEEDGALLPPRATCIAIEICRGLEAAHAIGVVHRDLKPANIFLHESASGGTVAKILDFGISRSYDEEGVSLSVTQTGVVMGTPQYMSAEQARGLDDIDLRTDVWGVGLILYEMMTTHRPFEGANYNALLYNIINVAPIPFARWGVTVPDALVAIVRKCLRKPRTMRYAQARELRVALEHVLASMPEVAVAAVARP